MSWRTNRRTRNPYREDSYDSFLRRQAERERYGRPQHHQPSKHTKHRKHHTVQPRKMFKSTEPVLEGPVVTRLGTRIHPTRPIPFYAHLRDAAGRKFNVRVMALDKTEAIRQINDKFPLAKIHKIGKQKIATVKRIVGTAERIAGFFGKLTE